MADQKALELIQEEKFHHFNQYVEANSGTVDLSDAHLRGYDLRKYDFSKANLTNAYLRHADIRGLDLSQANLTGASLKEAKISGVLFPSGIPAQEICMSVEHGTRLRTGGQ